MAATVGRLAFLVGANTTQFQQQMAGVTKTLGRLNAKTGVTRRLMGSLGGVTSVAGNAMRGAARAFTSPVAALGATAAAAISVQQVLSRGIDFEPIAAAFGSASERIGTSSQRFLSAMRSATRGTVSDFELMRQANDAVLLGVARDVDGYSDLIANAIRLGAAKGRSAAESVQDIVVGIGRQSRLILDNLGLLVSAEDAYANYAAQIGKSAAELTDIEKKQAFFNETLSQVTEKVEGLPALGDSTSGSLSKLTSSFQNLLDRAIQPTVRALGPMIDRVTAFVNSIPPDTVANFFLGMAESAETVVSVLATAAPVVGAFFGSFREVLVGPNGILSAVQGLAPPLLGLLSTLGGAIQQILAAAAPALSGLVSALVPLVTGAGTLIEMFVRLAGPVIAGLASGLGKLFAAFERLFNRIANDEFVQKALAKIFELLGRVGDALGQALDKLGEVAGKILDLLGPVLTGVVQKALARVVGALFVFANVAEIIATVMGYIVDVVDFVSKGVRSLVELLERAFAWLTDLLGITDGSLERALADGPGSDQADGPSQRSIEISQVALDGSASQLVLDNQGITSDRLERNSDLEVEFLRELVRQGNSSTAQRIVLGN